ncbi:MAG: hypothetical protein AAFY26_06095 [Cyanobacteria bacterium J06638_22]
MTSEMLMTKHWMGDRRVVSSFDWSGPVFDAEVRTISLNMREGFVLIPGDRFFESLAALQEVMPQAEYAFPAKPVTKTQLDAESLLFDTLSRRCPKLSHP